MIVPFRKHKTRLSSESTATSFQKFIKAFDLGPVKCRCGIQGFLLKEVSPRCLPAPSGIISRAKLRTWGFRGGYAGEVQVYRWPAPSTLSLAKGPTRSGDLVSFPFLRLRVSSSHRGRS